jgi:AraC-like DNA-binding protein
VIRRYRLHDAADRLAEGESVNWPDLALDLGYFDQAHFIKDFKAIVGVPPAEYARSIGSDF